MRSEKRKYIRFLAQDKLYAALGTHYNRVGKIKDIGIGGLAFEYIENTIDCEQDSSMITIFHSKDGFYLPELACIFIYDHPICMLKEKSNFKLKYRVKRCALQFTAISAHQKEKLEYFLNHYTCGLAPSLQEENLTP
jgi:hypothetical protein